MFLQVACCTNRKEICTLRRVYIVSMRMCVCVFVFARLFLCSCAPLPNQSDQQPGFHSNTLQQMCVYTHTAIHCSTLKNTAKTPTHNLLICNKILILNVAIPKNHVLFKPLISVVYVGQMRWYVIHSHIVYVALYMYIYRYMDSYIYIYVCVYIYIHI